MALPEIYMGQIAKTDTQQKASTFFKKYQFGTHAAGISLHPF